MDDLEDLRRGHRGHSSRQIGHRGHSSSQIDLPGTRGGTRYRGFPNTNDGGSRNGRGRQSIRNRSLPRVKQQGVNNTSDNQCRYRSDRNPHIGFKYLESLLEQPLEDAITKINENKGFYELLQKQLEPDYIVLIVKLISKFCDCEFSALRNQVLKKSLNTIFLNNIQLYITGLMFQTDYQRERNSYFWKDPDSFWENFSKACKTALKVMPQYYSEALHTILKCTLLNIPLIEDMHELHISDGIKKEFKNLVSIVQVLLAEHQKKESNSLTINTYEGEPPDDFREIDVYPTTQELIGDQRPFLRKNIVKGPYKNVEHYLDVQFRLLREDFVAPLREGIQAYLSKTKARIQNVKIHKKVQFLQPITVTEHYCALLKFNFSNKQSSFKYENSRQFMFGSLVCFTHDNFKSLIFGRIVDRDDKYLKKGELVIGFDVNEKVLYNTDYVMVECSVYFEPYYHVLTVMKSLTEEDFPMMNYIIDVDTSAAVPQYITRNTVYEIGGQGSGRIAWLPFYPLDRIFHNFNPSQNKAFIAALTRKFSIIQGPPGTGKTFVGLKIAQTLLKNRNSWYSRTPMLIICYTNHALDQFLEGLITTTDEIVRIGGQSKNENLQKFNLRNHPNRMSHSTYETKRNVTRCLSDIKSVTDTLAMIRKYDCIIDFKAFKSIISQFEESWLASAKKEDVLNWLLETEQKQNLRDYSLFLTQMNKLHIRGEVDDEIEEDDYEERDERFNNEIDDLLESAELIGNAPILSLGEVHHQIQQNYQRLFDMKAELETGNYNAVFDFTNLEMETNNLSAKYEYAKGKLDLAKQGTIIKPVNVNILQSQFIPRDDRWNLYFHWLHIYYDFLLKEHDRLNAQFRLAYKVYNESKDLENIKVLKNMKVIGMTTTGAARMHSSLQMIKSPIVIVEEAAEILEAHIVTSLTKNCQQLILIGDHQQLKPSTSNYRIETFYNLGISLFERMILNDVQCFTLNVQHRMKPEISTLIKPAIYPNLEDHESVFNRPNIRGMEKCLYFIDHKYPEEKDAVRTTKKNIYEVKFLIQLARYLILNGYKSEEITILAAYLGQMFELQKERSKYKYLLKDVKITVLDNYQGEECDIILLSLVRNNAENKIGFLSIDNRVCVALSRARNGLYVMGNMKQLCENSQLWMNIRESLMKQNALGPTLTLKCQNHSKITKISTVDDFSSVVEGGCDEICGMLLSCQHQCRRLCHVLDREHKDNKCQEQCNRGLCDSDASHICLKKCYEECGPCTYLVKRLLECNHQTDIECHIDLDTYNCLTEVFVTLLCGHETYKPCYIEREKHMCPFPCDTRLDCGHSCVRTCHMFDDPDHLQYKCVKPCGKRRSGCNNRELEGHMCPKLCWDECVRCNIIVRKLRTKCSHQYDVECYKNVDDIDCVKPCKQILSCGHKCKNACRDPCGPCTRKVTKNIPECNHTITLPCHVVPDKSYCSGKCPRIMSCGHVCVGKCNENCDPLRCQKMISVSIPARCGHTITRVPCSVFTLYKTEGPDAVQGLESYCTAICKEILNCGPENRHVCSGSCGACFQGRIHLRCGDKCGQILICNHECEISCRETCKPCRKPCSYKCRHSNCRKRCGEPCSKCIEECPRKCEHQKCRKLCGDICSTPPCRMPCLKKLQKCGHPCIGFCGDPCPPFCRICDKNDLEEVFFGTEDEEDARFVLLSDCGHVLESEGMENWLEQDKDEIKFKTCPKCKTTIYTTERYSDYVKLTAMDVSKVKVKQCGTKEENFKKRKTLEDNIRNLESVLRTNPDIQRYIHPLLKKYLDVLSARLKETNKSGRAQTVNSTELNSIEIKYHLLGGIYNILKKRMNLFKGNINNCSSVTKIQVQVKFILDNVFRNSDDITKTEIEDIQIETNRLDRMFQLGFILETSRSQNTPDIANKIDVVSELIHSLSRYEDTVDTMVKDHLSDLNKMLESSIDLTDVERREIVRAIGLSKGHWFKCPNGHPYAIGECGGAMQVGKCYECGAAIGGQSHRLLSTNAVSTEMDGARHAAWSDGANMANNDLRNVF